MDKFRQFRKMFAAHWKMTFREKQAWFWSIFFPVILMVIFMIIFGGEDDNDFSAKIAIVEEESTEATNLLKTGLKMIPVLEIVSDEPETVAQAEEMVKEKEIDAAVILPGEEGTEIRVIINTENEQGVTTQAVYGILSNYVQQINFQLAGVLPTYSLKTESISAGENPLKFTDFILTGMIALGLSQGGLFGMANQVDLRRKGVIKRLRMTPANMGLFGLSDMLMRMIFALFQLSLLSVIGVVFFDVTLHIHFLSLFMVFIIGALAFNAIGYFLSSFSKTIEAYMGMANIISFLMLFLSGVMFPIETMPEWIQPLSHMLPLTYFVEGIRTSMVYESFYADWLGIGNIILWGIVTFILGSLFYKRKSIVADR